MLTFLTMKHGTGNGFVEPFLHRLPLGPRGRKVRVLCSQWLNDLNATGLMSSDTRSIYFLHAYISLLYYIFIYIYTLFIRPMVYNRRLHFWRGNRGEFGWQILRGHLGHGYPRTLDTGDAGKGGQMQICAAQAVTCQVSWFSLAAHPADHPDHWATEKDPQRK